MRRLVKTGICIVLLLGIIGICQSMTDALRREIEMTRETAAAGEKMGGERLVVLDSGHGGSDSGKVGINEAKEKEINLKIAKKIQELLEAEKVEVIMTRESDEQLAPSKVEDLKKRVSIMNENSPALAVSIHQNSYREENVFGAQVFYYKTSSEGQKAAETIQEALQSVNPENTKKIKGNDTYYLLKKTEVPTVIVECGFLSNYAEAQKLITDEYQQKVAEAVTEGILQYIEKR